MTQADIKLRYRAEWLFIGYVLVLIVILSSIDPSPTLGLPINDKIAHFVAYGGLMGWFSQIYQIQKQRIIVAALLILLGMSMEFYQSTIPGRYYEFADMIANSGGVFLGWLFCLTPMQYILQSLEKVIPRKV